MNTSNHELQLVFDIDIIDMVLVVLIFSLIKYLFPFCIILLGRGLPLQLALTELGSHTRF